MPQTRAKWILVRFNWNTILYEDHVFILVCTLFLFHFERDVQIYIEVSYLLFAFTLKFCILKWKIFNFSIFIPNFFWFWRSSCWINIRSRSNFASSKSFRLFCLIIFCNTSTYWLPVSAYLLRYFAKIRLSNGFPWSLSSALAFLNSLYVECVLIFLWYGYNFSMPYFSMAAVKQGHS